MAGVYISYPFCNQKCSFCNFASGPGSTGAKQKYARALLDELKAHPWAWKPETVYWGGGTPSLMPPELLEEAMRLIPAERLNEVTLECAPGTLSFGVARCWRANGINRVSLGVQSFVADELRQTGRKHSADDVSRDVEILRDAGIENINIDLIAGLPAQARASWEESLDWMERIDPPHASIYIFEIDEDSRLGREVLGAGLRYGANRLPSEELTVECYHRAVERLQRVGMQRYEISNFAKPGWESRHNLKYWTLAPYAGFGLDAHSFDGTARWCNSDDLASYLAGGRRAVKVEANRAEERFLVGLRLAEGFEPECEELRLFAEPIEKWTAAGMLQLDEGRLKLTPEAVLLSNEILQDFVHA